MRKLLLVAALAIPAFFGQARADDDNCTKAPKEQWLSTDQLTAKLAEQGYKVGKVEFEEGCAEVEGTDKDGKKVELTVDPATGVVTGKDD